MAYADTVRNSSATLETVADSIDGIFAASGVISLSTYAPTYSASGSMTFTSVTAGYARYWRTTDLVRVSVYATGTIGGTLGQFIYVSLPVAPAMTGEPLVAFYRSAGGTPKLAIAYVNSTTGDHVAVGMPDASNWPATGASSSIVINGYYEV